MYMYSCAGTFGRVVRYAIDRCVHISGSAVDEYIHSACIYIYMYMYRCI